jgi:hypothetical protein
MTFSVSAKMTGLSAALDAAEKGVAQGSMRAMARAGDGLKEELRGQIRAAGMSERLAKTWQDKIYPTRTPSMTPAAYVWSKAPGIIDAYARGATIVAKAGRRFLAIPTDDAPRVRAGRAMTPKEVEARYGRRLVFISPSDKGFRTPSTRHRAVGYLVMRDLVVRKATGRWRSASQKELSGKTRNPRPVQMVIMFALVASVKVPKKLDLSGALNRAAATLPQLLTEEWSR